MKDFVGLARGIIVSSHKGNIPPTFPYVISSSLEADYVRYLLNIQADKESLSYKEACVLLEWVEAMQQEIAALEKNQTWELTSLPKGKKLIGCKWDYKVKLKANGELDRCKARLVAKGFN